MKIICHYSEIGLKGKNRSFFEKTLAQNIKKALKKAFFKNVKRMSGRILINLSKKGESNQKEIKKRLKRVFGLANFSFAKNIPQNINSLKKNALLTLKEKNFSSFKIETKRSNKNFPLNSLEVNQKVGEKILKNIKKDIKVDLENPDIICFIEIVEDKAYIYTEKIKAFGGLPVGTGGKAVSLISGGIDSPVASWYGIKRGLKLTFIHFHAYPFTNKTSIEKVEKIVSLLNQYQFKSKLYLVPFANIQKQIMLNAPGKLRVILYRRFMLRIAEKIAKKEKASALLTGGNLGQVASQTIENIRETESAINLPVLRPLIGFDKGEIINIAKTINTLLISNQPDQDCCSRFVPKHPETKANPGEAKKGESSLNVDGLIKKAIENIKLKTFK